MRENLPATLQQLSEEAQAKYTGPFGRLQLGNDMWGKLPDDEKEEYIQKVQDMKLDDLRSEDHSSYYRLFC